MGVFAEWQPRYAQENIATFPIVIDGQIKKPAIQSYDKIGLCGSEKLAAKFAKNDAFAFLAGARSGITIVDIDSPDDEDMLRDVLNRYGDTPAISRTGSGGFHCYYQHNGEGRKIRIDPSMPVDLLGGGMAVAPPSLGSGSAKYAYIRGNVANLQSLPTIKATALSDDVYKGDKKSKVEVGNRNNQLFRHLMRQARYVDTLDDLFDVARTFSDEQFAVPLPDVEVVRTAHSVWGYHTSGQNLFSREPTLDLDRTLVESLASQYPDAFALLCLLKINHKGLRSEFFLANAMAKTLYWSLPRFRKARDYLEKSGCIECVHRGGNGPKDPPVFRLS